MAFTISIWPPGDGLFNGPFRNSQATLVSWANWGAV